MQQRVVPPREPRLIASFIAENLNLGIAASRAILEGREVETIAYVIEDEASGELAVQHLAIVVTPDLEAELTDLEPADDEAHVAPTVDELLDSIDGRTCPECLRRQHTVTFTRDDAVIVCVSCGHREHTEVSR